MLKLVPTMRTKVLLIADDDDGVREALKSVVEFLYEERVMAGELEVLTAGDGNEAVQICCKSVPGMVLMDVNMPVTDGIDAFYSIMGSQPDVGLRTVFLTGYDDSETIRERLERAISDGADGYLYKPVTAGELREIVDRLWA
jgi:two-component system response regulator AtoC